jgi:hypothetical protein
MWVSKLNDWCLHDMKKNNSGKYHSFIICDWWKSFQNIRKIKDLGYFSSDHCDES